MSKSKGNVIDPLDLINEYGADSLRFTLISMASPGRDVKLSKDRVTGNRNFITKIWSANNFLKLNNCKLDKKINLTSIKLSINHWIYNEFIKTQNLITKNIEIVTSWGRRQKNNVFFFNCFSKFFKIPKQKIWLMENRTSCFFTIFCCFFRDFLKNVSETNISLGIG